METNSPNSNYPDAKDSDSLETGHQFQDFVVCELAKEGIILQNLASRQYQFNVGENLQGFEIKLDRLCTDTGRLSIEIAEKTQASNTLWVPSGIYRKDNTWLYIQGNYVRLYLFPKNFLVRLHESGKYKEHTEPTVKGFFLPLPIANKWCAKCLTFELTPTTSE